MSSGAHTTAARRPNRLIRPKSAGLSRSLQQEQDTATEQVASQLSAAKFAQYSQITADLTAGPFMVLRQQPCHLQLIPQQPQRPT